MRTNVGIWIDHKSARIVRMTDHGTELGLVVSKVERQLRRSGDSPLKGPYDPRQVPAAVSRQRMFVQQLKHYYDEVTACLRDADSLLIFGPGLAKGELRKRLQHHKFSGRIVGFETVDKMTDRQIAAKVRDYFPEE